MLRIGIGIVAFGAIIGALAATSVEAAQTAKQSHCMKTCRARYHDCLAQKQVPSFECRDVYQDCTRYTCAGLGPG